MRRHRAIGSVDLGIIERGLVDAALQIVGNQQLQYAAEEAEHADVRASPIRQLLRPRRLGIGEVRSAKHADKYFGLMDLARRRINNRDPFARVVHERLFSGDVMLAHHRAQPSLERCDPRNRSCRSLTTVDQLAAPLQSGVIANLWDWRMLVVIHADQFKGCIGHFGLCGVYPTQDG
jgi:hypothetical protein